MRVLALHWVEHGFGTPKMVHAIYIAKLLVFYMLGGVMVATATSRLRPFWHVAPWWTQPIVYQKFVLWTVLLETIGLAGSWGPMAGHFKPMTGGFRFWARPGTIRLPPWPGVPFTAGDRRTVGDVALYLAILATSSSPLVLPGVSAPRWPPVPHNTSGLVNPACCSSPIGLLVADRPARQGGLPGRPQRAVPARPGVLRRAAVRRHDHRAQAADRHRVDRRRASRSSARTSPRSSRRW